MTLEAQVKLLSNALKYAVAALEGLSKPKGRCVLCGAQYEETHTNECSLRGGRAALAATAEPATRSDEEIQADFLESRRKAHARYEEEQAGPAPRDAERTSQYARTLRANQRLGDAFATRDSPLDAEREALLAFGEKVLDACRDAVAFDTTGALQWTRERIDLAALLQVKQP